MNRKDFLASIGIGAAFALTASCLGSCKSEVVTPAGGVDFTLDVTAAANVTAFTTIGYVVSNGVVVVKTNTGTYVAATQTCSHEGRTQIFFNSGANEFGCSAHGARFSLTGTGLNANGNGGLTIYKTALTGTSLRVYS